MWQPIIRLGREPAAGEHSQATIRADLASRRKLPVSNVQTCQILSYHAFINQKIIPTSATRRSVTGVGKPPRKYQSQPRCVRIPGVSVTLVGVVLLIGLLATAET